MDPPPQDARGFREMIEHAAKARVPLDFITTHDYGVRGGALDAEGTQQLFLDPRARCDRLPECVKFARR